MEPNLFASRETRFNHLSEEERSYYKSLADRKPHDPEFLDGLLVTDWLAERTGADKKEIYQNLEANLSTFFGEGTTRAQAYDHISAYYRDQRQPVPINKAYGNKQELRIAFSTMLKSGASMLSSPYSWLATFTEDAALARAMKDIPETQAALAQYYGSNNYPLGKEPASERKARTDNAQARLEQIKKSIIPTGGLAAVPLLQNNPEYVKLGRRLFEIEGIGGQMRFGDQAARLEEIQQIKARLDQIQKEHEDHLTTLPAHIQKLARSPLFQTSQSLRQTRLAILQWSKSRDEYLAIDPKVAETFLGQLAAGAGSLPVTIAASLTGPVIGGALITSMMFSQAEEERMEHEGDNYDPSKAFAGNLITAVPQALLERLGPEQAVSRLIKTHPLGLAKKVGAKTAAKHAAKTAGRTSLEEALTEAAQGHWADQVASWTYDDERHPYSLDALERRFTEAAIGGILGAATGGPIGIAESAKINRTRKKILSKPASPEAKAIIALEAFQELQKRLPGRKSLRIISLTEQPLSAAEFALLRKHNTNETLAQLAPDEQTAHLLITAVNGSKEAQKRYNQLIRDRNSVDIANTKIGSLTLQIEEDNILVLQSEDGSKLRLYEDNPEERALALLAKTAATLKSQKRTSEQHDTQPKPAATNTQQPTEKTPAPSSETSTQQQAVTDGDAQTTEAAPAAPNTSQDSTSNSPAKPAPTLRTLVGNLRRARGSNQATTAAQEFIGTSLTNAETGIEAVISKSSWGKILNESSVRKSDSQQAHHQAAANVDTLFSLATQKSTKPDNDGNINIKGIHHFAAPMPFDGQVLEVTMLVKELTNSQRGNILYTLHAIEIGKAAEAGKKVDRSSKDAAPDGEYTPRGSGSTVLDGFDEKFASMVAEVKEGMAEADAQTRYQQTGVPQTLEQEIEARYERLLAERRSKDSPLHAKARLNDAQREAYLAKKTKQAPRLIDEQGIFSRALEPISEVLNRIDPATAQKLRKLEFLLGQSQASRPKPEYIPLKAKKKPRQKDKKDKYIALKAYLARLDAQRKKEGHTDRNLTIEEIKGEHAAREQNAFAEEADVYLDSLEEDGEPSGQPESTTDTEAQQAGNQDLETLAKLAIIYAQTDTGAPPNQASATPASTEAKTSTAKELKATIGHFLDAYAALPSDIRKQLDLALKNSDTTTRDLILKTYDMQDAFAPVAQTLEALHKQLTDAGFQLGYLPNYFVRKVSDTDGLFNLFNERGEALDDSSIPKPKESDVLIIDGEEHPKPSFFYKRARAYVDPEMNAFYADSAEALNTYIEEATKLLAYKDFFGKHTVPVKDAPYPRIDYEASVESLINELRAQSHANTPRTLAHDKSKRDIITPPQQTTKGQTQPAASKPQLAPIEQNLADVELPIPQPNPLLGERELQILRSLLLARFTSKAPHKATRITREVIVLSTISQFTSTITQLQDIIGVSLYESGVGNTLWAASKALFGKSPITAKELGLDSRSQTGLYDPSYLHKVINLVLKSTGFEFLDRVGKETIMNAKLRQLSKQARRGHFDPKARKYIDATFPADQRAQVIEDLKEAYITEDTLLLAYSVLANHQPINLSEYPRAYLTNPNKRLFYTLKTFTIKALNVYRRDSFNLIAEGIKTGNRATAIQGIRNFLHITALFWAAGLSASYLKDWLYGRPTKFSDNAIDSLWRIANMSRWYAYSFRNAKSKAYDGEFVQAAIESTGLLSSLFGPPIPFLTEPAKDIKNSLNAGFTKAGKPNIQARKESESVKLIPWGGALYYWRFGEGARKSEVKRLNRIKKENATKTRKKPKPVW